MNRLHRLSAAVVCVGFAAACGGNNRETTAEHENTTAATNAQSESDKPTGESESLSVTGCLTSADGRYVLTELAGGIESPAGSTTEAYQLTNADQKLRRVAGSPYRSAGGLLQRIFSADLKSEICDLKFRAKRGRLFVDGEFEPEDASAGGGKIGAELSLHGGD